jgi:O-antigen ligase
LANLPILRRHGPIDPREALIRRVPRLLVLVGFLVALITAWAIANGHHILIAPLIGVALYIILAPRSLMPFALVLVAVATFISAYALPRVAHFYPAELLVFLGLALLPFSNYRKFGGAVGVLVSVLLVAVLGGVEVAHINGIATLPAFDAARPMVIYAVFWVALAALRANPRRFLAMMAGFAVGIAALSLAQLLLHGVNLFRSAGETFVTPEPGGFTRVRPPGLMIDYFGLIFAACYLLWGPRRGRRTAIAFGCVTALCILISLNRNMLVGAILGLIAVVIASPHRSKAVVALGGVAIVVTVVLAFAASSTIGARILSLGNPSGLQQTTLSDREYEDSKAEPVIERHFVFGIGWGADYGADIAAPGTGDLTPRGFIHNQYYALILRTGIVGLASYIGLLLLTGIAGIRWLRARSDLDDSWLGAAVLASVVAFAASAIVGIYVIDPGSTPAVAALFALAAVLRERLSIDRESPAGRSQSLLAPPRPAEDAA